MKNKDKKDFKNFKWILKKIKNLRNDKKMKKHLKVIVKEKNINLLDQYLIKKKKRKNQKIETVNLIIISFYILKRPKIV